VTGGAGDNIVINDDLGQFNAGVGESWFVIRSPDGLKEFLFNRYNTNNDNWQISYSQGALWVGGDETGVPTAADSAFFTQASLAGNAASALHMGADDAAPYAFFSYMHQNGNFSSSQGGMAWVPITDAVQPGETDPYVFSIGISTVDPFELSVLDVESNDSTRARVVGIPAGQSSPNSIPAQSYLSDGGDMFPNGAPLDGNGNDLTIQVLFGRSSALSAPVGFKGFSDFMRWNGVARAAGETFNNRTRVSWGDVNFPWDGSVPQAAA